MTGAQALNGSGRRITGRMVLFGLLGFFGLVTAVNGVFIYFALETWPGLGAKDAYRQGLNYNDRLVAAEEQRKLGWTSRLSYAPGQLIVRLSDADGQPVSYARVTVKLGRPATDAEDRNLVLDEAGGGRYRTRVEPLDAGLWRAEVEAEGRRSERFRLLHDWMVKK